jgi:Tfp pilus assembly protein PilZ
MKRLLIGAKSEELLSTLELIIKHWGYRVLVSSKPEQLNAFLQETSPDILIMGAGLLGETPSLRQAVREKVVQTGCPLILIQNQENAVIPDIAHETLRFPIDIFALFAFIQKHLEKFPRYNLRLESKLPGMLCRGEKYSLSEVLSLSTEGLFIKTSSQLERGDRLRVIIPLIGMKKELEIDVKVLYRVDPVPENNYLAGVGLAFTKMDETTSLELRAFLENRLLGQLSASPHAGDNLSPGQLQSRTDDLTLRLATTSPAGNS